MKTTPQDDEQPEIAIIGDIQDGLAARIALAEARMERHLALMATLSERVDRIETVRRISGRA